ncbi:MAG: glycosyltransferase family 32 protein [Bacilli bacterium]
MTKIPKKIHYCWFGRGKKNELMNKCINSWKEKLSGYEIIEWNEDNFDIESNQYVKEAYDNKKYAFVTDYVRLYVLYNYGGIYMDTDVEVIKSIDCFLDNKAFSGFENNNYVPTGIMASQKGNKWIKILLEEYNNLRFVNSDGTFDLTTNVVRITNKTVEKYNLIPNNTFQDLGDVVFYPHDYFCPKDWVTGNIKITDNTYTIHHFNGSWHSKKEKRQNNKRIKYIEKYGEEIGTLRYSRYLKRSKVLNILSYPFKILCNPKKAFNRMFRGKKNEV